MPQIARHRRGGHGGHGAGRHRRCGGRALCPGEMPAADRARASSRRTRAGHSVAAEDTYASMGYSRGASALGVALALGEVAEAALGDAVVCRDWTLFSRRASTSAGVELHGEPGPRRRQQRGVVGRPGHRARPDGGRDRSRRRCPARSPTAGIPPALPVGRRRTPRRLVAVLAKAEAARSGQIRGARHTMLDDSDIQASRHARALVGGVLAGGRRHHAAVRLRRRRAPGAGWRRPGRGDRAAIAGAAGDPEGLDRAGRGPADLVRS